MTTTGPRGTQTSRFPFSASRPTPVSASDLTRAIYLPGTDGFPLVITPTVAGLNPSSWAAANRALVLDQLQRYGAILFRGFDIGTAEAFSEFASALCPDLLDYLERAAPRTEVADKVFTSTEFPADQPIPLHHEMSYSHHWPAKILFFCEQAAQERGATPIADDRRVFSRLDPALRQRFIDGGVMYVRNYGHGVDLPWEEAFQTDDPRAVESYCRESGIEFTWLADGALRTKQVRQAVVTHPVTRDEIWFNHAHLFHISAVAEAVATTLRSMLTDDELPRNAFYGDGTAIEAAVLDEVRGVYTEAAVTFPWERGDVLLLDNLLTSHGREPFVGPRRVLVAMAELTTAGR